MSRDPFKVPEWTEEICTRSGCSSFPSLRCLCCDRARRTGKPRPITLLGTSGLDNWHHITGNLINSSRKSVSPLCAWMWAMFKCSIGMSTMGLVPLCRFLSWIYPSKCQHTVWTRSLLDKPNLKSVHSRLGNCTCNFKLRVWGRLNYLEDLLGQHKLARVLLDEHGVTCGGGTPDAGAASQVCAQCSAGLWAPTLWNSLCVVCSWDSPLWLFCFYGQNSKSKWNSAKVPRFPGYRLKLSKNPSLYGFNLNS